jgi:ribosome-associated protein
MEVARAVRPTDVLSDLPAGVPAQAVSFDFVRSRGAGGQNVNKVATAVVLRLDVKATQLTETVMLRLLQIAGSRATRSGQIIIRADRHRTQARNRVDAVERLTALVQQAQHVRKPRRKTRASKAVRKRGLDRKGRRGSLKKLRTTPRDF